MSEAASCSENGRWATAPPAASADPVAIVGIGHLCRTLSPAKAHCVAVERAANHACELTAVGDGGGGVDAGDEEHAQG